MNGDSLIIDKDHTKANYNQLCYLERDTLRVYDLIEKLTRRQKQVGQLATPFTSLHTITKELEPLKQIWEMANQYALKRSQWWNGKLTSINSQNLQDSVNQWHKSLSNLKTFSPLMNHEEPKKMLIFIHNEIEKLKSFLPLFVRLRAKGLEKRHFAEMSAIVGRNIDPSVLTMSEIQLQNLQKGSTMDAIKLVSGIAFKENSIKLSIDAIEREIKEITFESTPYKDSGTMIVKNFEVVLQSMEECTIKLQALKGNDFSKFQQERIYKNEKEIRYLQKNFENWVKVQKTWVYLEPIYTQDDVVANLRDEKALFDEVNLKFKKIMGHYGSISITPVQEFCRSDGFTKTVEKMIVDLEILDKSLANYLEKKRTMFARLYFTSNDELIGLMGNLSNKSYVQVFLSKLFEGVAGLMFEDGREDEIVGFYSKSNEKLLFDEPISVLVPPEIWLNQIEIGMKRTIYLQLRECYAALRRTLNNKEELKLTDWLAEWPGQLSILAIQVTHNYNMEKYFAHRYYDEDGNEVGLKSIHAEVVEQLDGVTKLMREKTKETLNNPNTRFSICNFIINRIHTRDQLRAMMQEPDKDEQEGFFWKIQMKYHYIKHPSSAFRPHDLGGQTFLSQHKNEEKKKEREDGDGSQAEEQKEAVSEDEEAEGRANQKQFQMQIPPKWSFLKNQQYSWLDENEVKKRGIRELSVACMMARRQYGYEYLGNMHRLVITPLTDRCFRTMFLALHYSYGSLIEGPVGTGKTETTKELSKSLGKMSFVFTCSKTLSFDALIKFFKGFLSGGSWACFDEFNRIDTEVLSVLSQTIMVINQAHREMKDTVTLSDEEKPIFFNNQCAIFVTFNPIRYKAGRNELPVALMNQFRPIQMARPNSTIIAEVILCCQGFSNCTAMAQKLVKLLEFAKK